jgi:hypothetical protein
MRSMHTWIILPYDDSPVARAALHRAAYAAGASLAGVVLATAGVDPSGLDRLARRAQVIAGRDLPLEVRLLDAGDPIGDLHRLAATLPEAILAAPLGVAGCAPWYAEACRLGGLDHALMLFRISPREAKQFEESPDGRRGMDSGIRRLLRDCARLCLGVRTPVNETMALSR